MNNKSIFIGLMSGTSLDGIDVVATQLSPQFTLLGCASVDLPQPLRNNILNLCSSGPDEIDQMGTLDRELAKVFANAALQLLKQLNIPNSLVTAIGSHGQTIRHRPEAGFTLQVGDPNLIAELTGITTVADFRRRDMAVGGQGAPLVPAFHKALFQHPEQSRIIVNIGGMANITWLPPQHQGQVVGYDTGPGNVLMDAWIQKHLQISFDANGAWAVRGTPNATLLQQMLSLPFFQTPPPKSTGREQFNLAWLEAQLRDINDTPSPEDVQATLLELTARSIADAIGHHLTQTPVDIYLCGGGSHNSALLSRLSELLKPVPVTTTSVLGLDPDWVEACAFAWLAKQTLSGLSGNLPDVTGAAGERILGAIYPA